MFLLQIGTEQGFAAPVVLYWQALAPLGEGPFVLGDPSLFEKGVIVLIAFVVSLIFYLLVDRGWESLRRRMVRGARRGNIEISMT